MSHRRWDWEATGVYLACLLLNLVGVWYVVFRIRLFQIDAMARTLNAWMVFFSTEPKLSNMGFVWLPLPTLLQLPLILIPPLRAYGLAGNLLTALIGAGAATILYALLRHHRFRLWERILWLGAWVVNPMIWLYSSNAMSEIIAIFCLLLGWYHWDRWVDTEETFNLVGISLAMAMWFLTRYESLLFAGALLVLMVLHLWRKRASESQLWASVLLYGVPIAGTVILWLLVNWAIMGHPLYFAIGPYSPGTEAPLLVAEDPALVPLRSDWRAVVQNIAVQSWRLFPAVGIGAAFLIGVAVWRRSWALAGYLFFPLAFVASAIYNDLFGFPLLSLRYFILVIPLGVLLWVEGVRSLKPRNLWAIFLAVIAMAGSIPFTAQAMLASQKGIEENYAMSAFLGKPVPDLWANDRLMARYILEHAGYREVLADPRGESNVIFFTGRLDLFVLPADSDFKRILQAPYGQVRYILAIEKNPEHSLDQISETYPDLAYQDDVGWARLVFRAYPFRLYEVLNDPYRLPPSAPSEWLKPPLAGR